MMKQNQRGITLIELLITLAVLSMIGILVWGVFFQGTNYSNKAMIKNQMQQEANIIMTKLTKIHQTSDSYEIDSLDTCSFTVKDNDGSTEVFEHDRLCFSVSTNVPNPIHSNDDDVELELTIYDNKDSKNTLTIHAFLYRLKGGDS
ncbi:type II secretion system protein [Bacillus sp. V3B]|uniref:PulJ/GspJ family protein n=1 Tax=Bacillus sp. V3B TaxID=2804915 RepID=UPI00210B62F1|nr:type II secretion system protein [Bacillus sp. V3B]MCQ6273510.1 type II secretion system protein [Bacillus sp. V3B]